MGTSLALSEAACQDTSCLRRGIQVWRFGFAVYGLGIPFRDQVWMVILAAFLINGFNPFLNKIKGKSVFLLFKCFKGVPAERVWGPNLAVILEAQ